MLVRSKNEPATQSQRSETHLRAQSFGVSVLLIIVTPLFSVFSVVRMSWDPTKFLILAKIRPRGLELKPASSKRLA